MGSLSIKEVNSWLVKNKENLLEIEWENNEGKYIKSFACLDIKDRLENLKNEKNEIKIINPFDPAIRDRKRLKKIFDFDYKIEIFVPKEKRVWGYYVYPILQGNKFIARIELQANRKIKELKVINFWKEDGIIWTENQQAKLDIELSNFALFIGIETVIWL